MAGNCRKIGKLLLNVPYLYKQVGGKIIEIGSVEQEI